MKDLKTTISFTVTPDMAARLMACYELFEWHDQEEREEQAIDHPPSWNLQNTYGDVLFQVWQQWIDMLQETSGSNTQYILETILGIMGKDAFWREVGPNREAAIHELIARIYAGKIPPDVWPPTNDTPA